MSGMSNASHGIRVNAVSPGIIMTPMHPVENHEAPAACFRSAGLERKATWSMQ
jgi:NAD(P)-dependent dehydrogenase (short-subunit alcohol dehydrogenase family)